MACRPAISSMSLGRAWVHDLPEKLRQAHDHGFEGIEVFYEDLEFLARAKQGMDHREALIAAASEVRGICDRNSLEIVCLQPFAGVEGVTDVGGHEGVMERLKLWVKLCQILKTDIIQIPSNTRKDPGVTGEVGRIVADLKEIADFGLQQTPNVRFAYENLAWGTFVDTWEAAWAIVTKVDKPNFGMCLDTFNITARVFGDPTGKDGKTSNADEALRLTLEKMKATIDIRKVWFVQVVGAEKLDAPLKEGHPWWQKDQPARMTWSRNARLFAYEEDRGQYLPIYDVFRVITHDLGYQGWISLELFSRSLAENDASVPKEHARRGAESWKKLVHEFSLR